MVHGRVQSEKAGIIEGIIDVGIVVIAHFETSATMGAYHIMTEYLGVDRFSACKALTKTLETKSPAFYEDISVDMVTDALEYALAYKIESWDGYIVSLAKNHGAVIIYSIDGELAKRVKEVEVINPIPGDVMRKYHDFVAEIRE